MFGGLLVCYLLQLAVTYVSEYLTVLYKENIVWIVRQRNTMASYWNNSTKILLYAHIVTTEVIFTDSMRVTNLDKDKIPKEVRSDIISLEYWSVTLPFLYEHGSIASKTKLIFAKINYCHAAQIKLFRKAISVIFTSSAYFSLLLEIGLLGLKTKISGNRS